jgi:hypothetical protein
VHVDRDLREFPWFAVYDMEAMLLKSDERSSGGKLAWTHEHQPVSASVCSNVSDFESEKFFFNSNPDPLAANLVAYLESIADRGRQLAQQRWADAWAQLDALLLKWPLTPRPAPNVATAAAPVVDDADVSVADSADDDDDHDGCDGEAMESTACEPPTKSFLKAISHENTFYRFLHNLETTSGRLPTTTTLTRRLTPTLKHTPTPSTRTQTPTQTPTPTPIPSPTPTLMPAPTTTTTTTTIPPINEQHPQQIKPTIS